jgi:hypothetical protein
MAANPDGRHLVNMMALAAYGSLKDSARAASKGQTEKALKLHDEARHRAGSVQFGHVYGEDMRGYVGRGRLGRRLDRWLNGK